jgi:hypothetical protein
LEDDTLYRDLAAWWKEQDDTVKDFNAQLMRREMEESLKMERDALLSRWNDIKSWVATWKKKVI